MSLCHCTCKAIIYLAVGAVWLLVTPNKVWLLFEGSDVCITEQKTSLQLGSQTSVATSIRSACYLCLLNSRGQLFAGAQNDLFAPNSVSFTVEEENHEVPTRARTQRPATSNIFSLAGRLDMFGWAIWPRSLSAPVLTYSCRPRMGTAEHRAAS